MVFFKSFITQWAQHGFGLFGSCQPEVFLFALPHAPALPITALFPVDESLEPENVLMEDRESYLSKPKAQFAKFNFVFLDEILSPLWC